MSSTIVVSFYNFVPDSEIKTFLRDHNVRGTEISYSLKRYTIEVPVGQEDRFCKLLQESELVRLVCPTVLKGYQPRKQDESDKTDNSGKERPKNEKRQGGLSRKPR